MFQIIANLPFYIDKALGSNNFNSISYYPDFPKKTLTEIIPEIFHPKNKIQYNKETVTSVSISHSPQPGSLVTTASTAFVVIPANWDVITLTVPICPSEYSHQSHVFINKGNIGNAIVNT